MQRFLAVHTLPFSKEQFQSVAEKTLKTVSTGFTWKQTYCDFSNHKFFCEWEAPSQEALEKGFKANKMPFDAIYPVELYNTSAKTLEK
jgi:hypothetical protein